MPEKTDSCLVDDLPTTTAALLWSYRIDANGCMPLPLVAAAVMERGSLADMRWLLTTIGAARLRSLLPGLASRLSPRALALWTCILEAEPRPPTDGVPWIAA